MGNRITDYLVSVHGGRKLLVPFFTAGYPSIDLTVEYVKAAERAGADFIELGVPFSDPLADGPEIQFSSYAALQGGISVKKILHLVSGIRKFSNIPLILMGYYNPMLAYGVTEFIRDASSHGVDGLIIPDLPVEEAGSVREAAARHAVSLIFLVSPTSSDDRIRMIDIASTDFVYAVTVTGVTGTGKTFDTKTDAYLKHLRRLLSRRFVAGFGVSSPDTASRLARYADGVVIGSALIKLIRSSTTEEGSIDVVEKFLTSVREAL